MRATTPERPLRDAARRGAALALLASLLVLAVLAVAPAAQAWDVLTPTGTDPSAVTDRDGTTHVVWDVTHANSYDTVDYCQIPRGATTCATTVDLTPECTTDPGGTTQPIAWKQDQSDSRWHGDKPRVMVTRFGDVYITTHGVCPLDWQAYGTSNPPWSNFQGVDREITMHSADGGATFDSSSGQARANGPKYTADQGAVFSDDRSDTVYDEADNRFVTVQDAYGGDIHGNSGNDGLFVLGNQPPPPMSDGQITAGRLVPFPDGGNPVLVQRGRGSFATAYLRQQAGGIGIRTYDCAGCPLADLAAAADWSSEILLPDEDHQPFAPKIVSGPAGTFVFYHTSPPDPNFWVRKLTGTTLGPRSKIMPAQDVDVETGDIAEDPANGRLIAAFQVATNASEIPWETDYVVSDDGGMTWTPAAKAADAPPGHSNDAMNTSITESTGDNGFTGLMFQYRDLDSGPIYVTALPGSGLPPAGGGGGGTPPGDGGGDGSGGGSGAGGGGASGGSPLAIPPTTNFTIPTEACKVKEFGPLDIKANACFTVDPKTGAVTAKGGVSVNGMSFAGADVTFDPKLRTVKSSGPVTVAIGDTKLFKLPIDWKLPAGNVFTLPSIDLGDAGGSLKGFPVTGSADVELVRGGVQIPVHIGLPSIFGGVTGDVTLRADNLTGLHLRDIHVKANLATLGPLTFSGMEFDYNPDEDKWSGGATLALPPKPPGPIVSASVGFAGGDLDFVRGSLTFPGEGIPLDTFDAVHLTTISFGLVVKPLELTGALTLTAGPRFGDVRVAEIVGGFDFKFPSDGPATLRATGDLSLLSVPVASAYLQYTTNGLINFGGNFSLGEDDLFSIGGKIDGWILPPKAFSVEGSARVCVGDLGCDGGQVGISSKGIAACVSILGDDVGVGYEWGPLALWTPAWLADIDVMFSGCSVADYLVAAPARAAQAGGDRTVAVGAGLPFTVFRVRGTDGPPRFTLTGPDGRTVDTTAPTASKGATAAVLHVVPQKLTLVVVNKPAAGKWTIAPAADSSPIAEAGHADGLPAPSVRARVSGKGRARVLTYKIKPLRGQKVRFEERGGIGKAGGDLGYAKGSAGHVKFTPAKGPAGSRTIYAFVESFGTPRKRLKVATYTAPPPERPGKVKALKLRRSGTKLVVSWKATGMKVSRYRLVVKLSDGRSLLLLPKPGAHSATVPDVAKKLRATATLRGELGDGTAGPAAKATLRAR